MSAVVPAVVGLVGFRMKGRASAIVLSCAAGLGFTGVALASRGVGANGLSWTLLLDPLLWAIIVHGAIGMSFFTVALQRDAVILVTAITLVFEVLLPSLVGIVLFGDAIALATCRWQSADSCSRLAERPCSAALPSRQILLRLRRQQQQVPHR